MSEEIVFDEQDAINFILRFIPEEDRKGLSEDDVQYVLDVIYDFYESKGLIEDDDETTDAAEIDEEEMLAYARKAVKKDHMPITDTQLQLIIEGEYEYGVLIGIYSEEE